MRVSARAKRGVAGGTPALRGAQTYPCKPFMGEGEGACVARRSLARGLTRARAADTVWRARKNLAEQPRHTQKKGESDDVGRSS